MSGSPVATTSIYNDTTMVLPIANLLHVADCMMSSIAIKLASCS